MTGATPGVVKEIHRDQLAQTAASLIKGLTATYAHAHHLPTEGNAIAESIAQLVSEYIEHDSARFYKGLERSAKRYLMIEDGSDPT